MAEQAKTDAKIEKSRHLAASVMLKKGDEKSDQKAAKNAAKEKAAEEEAALRGGAALADVHAFVEHFTDAVDFVCCIVSVTEYQHCDLYI